MATIPSEVTAVAGTVLTAATWNANVRDAVNFIITPPLFLGRQTVGQSLSTGVWAGITLDTEDIDRDGGHSTVTNTSRYTAQTAGWYQVDCNIDHGGNATGLRAIGLRINGTGGTGPTSYKVQVSPTASFEVAIATGGPLFLNVADWVEMIGFQASGGGLATGTADGASRMGCRWIST